MPDLQDHGKVVQARRRALKLSQRQLADKADVHLMTISRIERGVQLPTRETLHKLARALDLTLDVS